MEQSAGSAGIGRGHQGLARGRGEHFPLARASRLGRSCTPRTPHRPLLDLQWEQPPHQRASLRADWVWLGFTWLGSEQTTLRHWVAGFPDRDLCYQLPPKVIWSLRNWLHRTEFWILNSFIFSQLKMTQCPDNALRIDNWCMSVWANSRTQSSVIYYTSLRIILSLLSLRFHRKCFKI